MTHHRVNPDLQGAQHFIVHIQNVGILRSPTQTVDTIALRFTEEELSMISVSPFID